MSPAVVVGYVAYIILSLTTIGMLFDDRPSAAVFELVRCVIFLYMCATQSLIFSSTSTSFCAQLFFAASAVLWILNICRVCFFTRLKS